MAKARSKRAPGSGKAVPLKDPNLNTLDIHVKVTVDHKGIKPVPKVVKDHGKTTITGPEVQVPIFREVPQSAFTAPVVDVPVVEEIPHVQQAPAVEAAPAPVVEAQAAPTPEPVTVVAETPAPVVEAPASTQPAPAQNTVAEEVPQPNPAPPEQGPAPVVEEQPAPAPAQAEPVVEVVEEQPTPPAQDPPPHVGVHRVDIPSQPAPEPIVEEQPVREEPVEEVQPSRGEHMWNRIRESATSSWNYVRESVTAGRVISTLLLLILIGCVVWYFMYREKQPPEVTTTLATSELVAQVGNDLQKPVETLKNSPPKLATNPTSAPTTSPSQKPATPKATVVTKENRNHKKEKEQKLVATPTTAPAPVVNINIPDNLKVEMKTIVPEPSDKAVRDALFVKEREEQLAMQKLRNERKRKAMDPTTTEDVKFFIKSQKTDAEGRLWISSQFEGELPSLPFPTSRFSHRIWCTEVVPAMFIAYQGGAVVTENGAQKEIEVWAPTGSTSNFTIKNNEWNADFHFTPKELKFYSIEPSGITKSGVTLYKTDKVKRRWFYDAPQYDHHGVEISFVPTEIGPCDLGVSHFTAEQQERAHRELNLR